MKTPVKSRQRNLKFTSEYFSSKIQKIEDEFDNFLQDLEPRVDFNTALNSARSKCPTMQDREDYPFNFVFLTKKRVVQTDTVFNNLIEACCFSILDIREEMGNENWQQSFDSIIKMVGFFGQLKMCQLYKTSTARKGIASKAGTAKNAARSTLAILLIQMIEAQAGSLKYKSTSELINSIDWNITHKLLADFSESCKQSKFSYPVPLDENLPKVIEKMIREMPDFKNRVSIFLA